MEITVTQPCRNLLHHIPLHETDVFRILSSSTFALFQLWISWTASFMVSSATSFTARNIALYGSQKL